MSVCQVGQLLMSVRTAHTFSLPALTVTVLLHFTGALWLMFFIVALFIQAILLLLPELLLFDLISGPQCSSCCHKNSFCLLIRQAV